MQLNERPAGEIPVITDMNDLPESIPKPDWNCLRDYGFSDDDYFTSLNRQANDDDLDEIENDFDMEQ